MKNNKREKYSTFSYLKIIFTTDIRYLYILIIEIISSAFWALAPLGLTGYILTIYEKNQTKDGLLLIIMVCGIYTLFRLLISGVTIFVYNELVERIYRRFQNKIIQKILKKVLDVDLKTYQSPEFLNNYQKVVDNVTDNMVGTFWDVVSLAGGLTSLLGIGTILSIINPIIMIYGAVIGIASYFISKATSKIMHDLSEKNKQLIRERGYVRRVFYLKDYAIDLRTTKIDDYYLNKNEQYGDNIIKNLNTHYKKYNILNSLDQILLNSVFAVALAIVTMTVIKANDIVILATLISSIMYYQMILVILLVA